MEFRTVISFSLVFTTAIAALFAAEIAADTLGSRRVFTGASEPELNVRAVHNQFPLVSFQIYTADATGKLSLPPQKDRSFRLNEAGLPVFAVDGKDAIHVATMTGQASGISNNDLDQDGGVRAQSQITPSMKVALDWMEQNIIELEGDAATWHYTFEYRLNDIGITSGWPSAFSQADAIKALMMAAHRSGNARYLDLARKAAYAFTVPCEKGGLRCEVGGEPWFAEFPAPYGYAPMILNGHLYSLVMLHRLAEETKDDRIRGAFQDGLASARRLLLRYDSGYWSQYQLRPRLLDLFLTVEPSDAETELREVSISSQFSSPSTLVLGPEKQRTFPGNDIAGAVTLTQTGARLDGKADIIILPGRLSVDHDPVSFTGFDLTIRFVSRSCELGVGTYDFRDDSRDRIRIPELKTIRSGDECIAHGKMPSRINQWSTLSSFYHDWHTRLVSEIWRITKDPKFYVTAIRWKRYDAIQRQHLRKNSIGTLLDEPVYTLDSPNDDQSIAEALEGVDPKDLTEERAEEALRAWTSIRDSSALVPLLRRIGQQPSR